MLEHVIHGPLLNPRPDGSVEYLVNGALKCDGEGRIDYVGDWASLQPRLANSTVPIHRGAGIITPPFLDIHTHIPQFPIRGDFLAGIDADPPEGRLLAGLKRNVFPTEARCADEAAARRVVESFHRDTLAHGVVGGAAYMTTHAAATRLALETLPETWSVGLVMMNRDSPENLRTDEANFESDVESMAHAFGRRFIVTDRFAVAVDSALRQRASALAARLALRMQTHLNEQLSEKNHVEKTLHPECESYAHVYLRDGLLNHRAILAHCVWMNDVEFDILRATDSCVAHCPTSNMLLGSGVMRLDALHERGIPYALATDMGASPTTSMLAEMAQFLKLHAGRSKFATPERALFLATLSPAGLLGMDQELGSFEIGKSMSYIQVQATPAGTTAEEVILRALLQLSRRDLDRGRRDADYERSLDRLAAAGVEIGPELQAISDDVYRIAGRMENRILSVTMGGRTVWKRASTA